MFATLCFLATTDQIARWPADESERKAVQEKMILTIDLTSEQQAALEAEATARGLDPTEFVRLRLLQGKPKARRGRTRAEIAAGWKASGLPSVYARDPRDTTVIARELRAKAERRDWSEE